MAKTTEDFEQIPFRLHPRVFSALGADLVTSDNVAFIELVKNSYDAFATEVWVDFEYDKELGDCIVIEDNGYGMTREIIEDVWCLVATPYKEENNISKKGKKTRRVVGEKGLGRLSVARLGNSLKMFTQSAGEKCWEVNVNWKEFNNKSEISSCNVDIREFPEKSPFKKSGTILKIYNLKDLWEELSISDLRENLARLISPFTDQEEFNIYLTEPGLDGEGELVEVESPDFLSKPKYSFKGGVDKDGNIKGAYNFSSIDRQKKRQREISYTWSQVYDSMSKDEKTIFNQEKTNCGPFSFEIRAWDIGSEDVKEISERFEFGKTQIRRYIKAHKGISVYRDSVLVLPKSDNARDWLGLDLRRVSKVGTRMSTSQIVGYVSIDDNNNPKIKDTSDRERLVSNTEVKEFEKILKTVVGILENERDQDREKPDREEPMKDLFGSLSAEEMVSEVIAIAQDGGTASDTVSILKAFSQNLDKARKTIQDRFVFYSRMATIGTIAQMLVHEIRNKTTIFDSFLNYIAEKYMIMDRELEEEHRDANRAVVSLERLADTFLPLASRNFRRKKRKANLEERIEECVSLKKTELEKKNIKYHFPKTTTEVAVDPGELDAIILNLIDNAMYWLNQVQEEERILDFKLSFINDGERVRIWVHDSGPGIEDDDLEKVFWPGMTRKPGGIGMGLTVASELVAEYEGRMSTKSPGTNGGASFAFDLPIK